MKHCDNSIQNIYLSFKIFICIFIYGYLHLLQFFCYIFFIFFAFASNTHYHIYIGMQFDICTPSLLFIVNTCMCFEDCIFITHSCFEIYDTYVTFAFFPLDKQMAILI